MTLKQLSQLEWEQKCIEYPNMPPHTVPKTKFSDKKANDLTKAVIAYINLTGHHAHRVNNAGVYRPGKTIDRGTEVIRQKGAWTSNTRRGIADIDSTKKITISGRTVGLKVDIEVKVGKDRISEHQKQMKAETEQAGGHYLIVRSFENFIEQWEEII